MKTLLANASILDLHTGSLKKGMDVLIFEGKILEIGSSLPRDTQVIDVQGKVVMPGLIDAHVHVTAIDIDLANTRFPESEVSIQAGKFLEDMLQRGFTSVRDAGGADFGLAESVQKGLIKGPRLFFSGKALSATGGHGDFRDKTAPFSLCGCCCPGSYLSRLADGVPAVRAAARDELRKGAHQIKIMASGGVASPTDKITDLQYSPDEIAAIVEEATDHGTYVLAHAYSPQAIQRCISCGVRCIEHGNLLDAPTAKLMKEQGVFLVPTLVVYKSLFELGPKLGFPQDSLQKLSAVREQGLKAIQIARKAGVPIGFGTDLLGPEAHRMQMEEFAIRSAVEKPQEILHSATEVNAEIIQMRDKLGKIKVGAYADLLVIDGNPMEDLSVLQPKNLVLIMKEGLIYKDLLSKK